MYLQPLQLQHMLLWAQLRLQVNVIIKNMNSVRHILEERSQDLLRFLESFVHSRVEAEDLFQSGAVRVIEKAGELQDREKAYSWILSVFRNLALDFLRKKQRQAQRFSSLDKDAVENMAGPVAEPVREPVCGCGEKLLEDIPESYSSLLRSVDVQGRRLEAVAKNLGISRNNASVRLHRARGSLKRAVQEHCNVRTLRDCLDCECESK